MTFTVYLGEVPEDVVLAAVSLNGEEYVLPFASPERHTIRRAVYANNTQGYTLTVPFAHPVVERKVNFPPPLCSGSRYPLIRLCFTAA